MNGRSSTARSGDEPLRLVVVGASRGGTEAVGAVLGALPANFPAAVAVAVHVRPGANRALAAVLAGRLALPVAEAEDKAPLRPGCVVLAPPDYHLLIEPGHCALSTDEPVAHARPSVDVLFESAADAYGPALAAVILTGSGRNGAQGLAAVAARGGLIVVQDPASAEAPEMPRAAIAAAPPARILPLESIGPFLAAVAAGGAG